MCVKELKGCVDEFKLCSSQKFNRLNAICRFFSNVGLSVLTETLRSIGSKIVRLFEAILPSFEEHFNKGFKKLRGLCLKQLKYSI